MELFHQLSQDSAVVSDQGELTIRQNKGGPVPSLVNRDPGDAGLGDQGSANFCPEFLKSTQQSGSKFGCIPLTPTIVYQGHCKVWQTVPNVLQAHKII